ASSSSRARRSSSSMRLREKKPGIEYVVTRARDADDEWSTYRSTKSAMRSGCAMRKRHVASPLARHMSSLATSVMPKLSSHHPDEYPELMMHAGVSRFWPLRTQASDSNEYGWS